MVGHSRHLSQSILSLVFIAMALVFIVLWRTLPGPPGSSETSSVETKMIARDSLPFIERIEGNLG